MKRFGINVSVFLILFVLSGCASQNQAAHKRCPAGAIMEAKYTSTPIKIDGKLDDAAWKNAAVYNMNLPADQAVDGKQLENGGEVQMAWDDEYFYLGIKFYDGDIVAEGDKDQQMHYQLGDLCELFLKPADNSWYWELYVTPRSKKSNFWFPGWGRLGLPGNFEYECNLKVAAQNAGTVNNWQDKDKYWTGEMAMPIKDLTAHGGAFGSGADWRILVARYNYSRYLNNQGPEYSTAPKLSATNYHLLPEYAILRLTK